ncbi:hypothetical protein ABW20_dc0109065 [Dactylellina cionopaga]|nr:hypothetical protein ABW20_dc0109065 [Dactylellina cionopaga]
MSSLQALTEQEVRMVATLSLSQTSDIMSSVEKIAAKLDSEFAKTPKIDNEVEKRGKLDRIQPTLDPDTSVIADYETCAEGALKGTGDWIYDEPQFTAWKTFKSRHPMIWLSGPPGVGKSHLSSQVIKHLNVLSKTLPNTQNIVAYFFCRDNDPRRRSLKNVLRSLAWQCANFSGEYLDAILPVCESAGGLQHLSITSLWEKLFVERTSDMIGTTVYLVIDGTDEAYREELGTWLEAFNENMDALQDYNNLKVLIVGRPEIGEKLEEAFELDKIPPTIKISAQKNNSDIRQYITEKLNKSRLKKIDKTLKQEIIDSLVLSADGMFLYVNLMLDEITKKTRAEQIRQVLKSLPRGLSATFERTFRRYEEELDEDDILVVNRLLSWMLDTGEPPTLADLKSRLGVRNYINGRCEGDPGDDLIDLGSDIKHRYSSLFSTYTKEYHPTLKLPSSPNGDPSLDNMEKTNGSKDVDENPSIDFDEIKIEQAAHDDRAVYVKFCHASLGDFLISRKAVDSGINITKDLAGYWMAVDALNNLYRSFEDQGGYFCGLYGVQWNTYFQNVNFTVLAPDAKLSLITLIQQVFTKDTDVILRANLEVFMYDIGFFSKVKYLIRDPEVLADAGPELLRWIGKLDSNFHEELLLPAVTRASELWIESADSKWPRLENGIDIMYNSGPILKPVREIFAIDHIYQAARLSKPPENSRWLAAVGKALMRKGHYEESRKVLLQAIILDKENGRAFTHLQKLYCEETRSKWYRQTLIWYPEKYSDPLPNPAGGEKSFEHADEWTKNLYFGVLRDRNLEFDLQAEIKQIKYHAMVLKAEKDAFGKFWETLTEEEALEWIIKLSKEPPGSLMELEYWENKPASSLEQILSRNAVKLYPYGKILDETYLETFIADTIRVCRTLGRRDVIQDHILGYLTHPGSKKASSEKEIDNFSSSQINSDGFARNFHMVTQDPDKIARVGFLLQQLIDWEDTEDGKITDEMIFRMENLMRDIDAMPVKGPFAIQDTATVLLASMCLQKLIAEPDKTQQKALELVKIVQRIPIRECRVNGTLVTCAREYISVIQCHMLSLVSADDAEVLAKPLLRYSINMIRTYHPRYLESRSTRLVSWGAIWAQCMREGLSGMMPRAFVALGDMENAKIAFYLQQNPYPIFSLRSNIPKSELEYYTNLDFVFPAPASELVMMYEEPLCAGSCTDRFKKTLSRQNELFECIYCYTFAGAIPHQAIFCKECYGKLQDGEMKSTVCHKSHLFLHWKGGTLEMREKANQGILVVDDEEIVLQDWLRKVEERYMLI